MKLLDYFNAYNCSPEMAEWEPVSERTEKDWNTTSRIYKAYILSKDYGWIKRLVKNDKIDLDKVDKSWNKEMSFVDFKLDNIMEIRIKVVFMLLAIQDEPLKFLESILK